MTTDRPYRKRLPLEVVIAELQKCKGTQFDAELVDVVVSSVGVRRLIAGPSAELEQREVAPSRSRRVSWPAGALWKIRGA
jgi:HD-GYP domain-containing protein (c-di-GMP phosphodiesterase class II)